MKKITVEKLEIILISVLDLIKISPVKVEAIVTEYKDMENDSELFSVKVKGIIKATKASGFFYPDKKSIEKLNKIFPYNTLNNDYWDRVHLYNSNPMLGYCNYDGEYYPAKWLNWGSCTHHLYITKIYNKQIKEKKLLINKKPMSITTTLKKITRKEPEKTFVEVGFLDEETEEITEEGLEALHYILWKEKKDELKELAQKILKEKEK